MYVMLPLIPFMTGLCLLGGAYYNINSTTALVDSSTSTCPTRHSDVITNCNTCVAVKDCVFCSTEKYVLFLLVVNNSE